MKKLNLVELLKNCPSGMELDCINYNGVVTFEGITECCHYPIKISIKYDNQNFTHTLTKYGQTCESPYNKCVIFPKGKTTWEGFVPPCKFKDGDIIVDTLGGIHIMQNSTMSYCYFDRLGILDKTKTSGVRVERLATEEEKQKLFKAIQANGYKWNAETKTLEKLVEPRFKVGDKIEKCGYIFTIAEVKDDYYLTKCGNKIPIDNQNDFSLVPDKFDIDTLKPFESRVLVRDYDNQIWIPTFWGKRLEDDSNCRYLTTNGCYKYCIPDEDNHHLLGTTNDCDPFFKTWEK